MEGGMEGDLNEIGDETVNVPTEALDPNNPDDAYAILERDFNKLIVEMEEDTAGSRYVEDFQRTFDFLYKTREQALSLEAEKKEMEERMVTNEERLESCLELIKTDSQTIDALKEEIQNSHHLIDNAHEREQAAQEFIDNLRRQIANLNAEIDFKTKMAQSEMEENPQVAKHREGLEREKVKLMSEVSKLKEKLENATAYQEELEHRTSQADLCIAELGGQIEESNAEVERFKRNKEKLELDLEETREEVLRKEAEMELLNDTLTTNQKLIVKYEGQLKDQTNTALKCLKELETWNARYTKMQNEFDALNYTTQIVKKEYNTLLHDLKAKDDERARLHIDISKLTKQKEQAENMSKRLEGEKLALVEERVKLREVISSMERDLSGIKLQADNDRRNIENFGREKDILNKNLLRQQAVSRDHTKLIKVQEQAKRKLESEIDGHVIEGRKQQKQISYLEKERDRLLEEELELTKKIEDTLDEVRLKKTHIFDLKKLLADNENKLRMQQNLFDGVRADRNALQKTLHESLAENHDLKQKLKTNGHQTEQLKEDIAMKEQLLIKEETILRKITKEKENMGVELNNCNDTIRFLKYDISEHKNEEKHLHKVIVQSDRKIRDQAKTLTQLMNERDVLGSQLVRRNDELALLYEKIKILQTTLHRGEAQYDQRLQDIKLLKVEIKRLRQEKILLTKSINNINDLKQEVFHLERDLTRERLKSKALEDELQNPMNIHRWRKLEGSDPEVFELLQKINLLQKRLLHQASQAIDRERQLKDAETMYMSLRQVVAKQPGPAVQARLVKTQKALTTNINKMKCLVSELNLMETLAKEYKLSLDTVNEELNDVRKKLIMEKKQHAKDMEVIKELSSKVSNQEQQQQTKFVGGGFHMSPPQKGDSFTK